MTLWTPALVHQPGNGDTVWIRRIPIFDTPVQAEWEEADQAFKLATDAGVTKIPLYEIHSWRPV